MTLPSATLRVLATAVITALLTATPAWAVTYTASLIHPTAFPSSQGFATDGSTHFGVIQTPVNYTYHAAVWNNSPSSGVDLNPTDSYESRAYSASGNNQAGFAMFRDPGAAVLAHAALWHGTAASFVDLHPTGYIQTWAYGVSGDKQVGYGTTEFYHQYKALLWNSTAASAVDLTPAGFDESAAYGIDGNDQVGSANVINNIGPTHPRAMLWHGAAAGAVNLNPSSSFDSSATAVRDGYQGGWVKSPTISNGYRAAIWKGSAASFTDFHPSGYSSSIVNNIGDGRVVGQIDTISVYPDTHAAVWTLAGGAASAIDLHSLLSGLGKNFVLSTALAISEDGVIIGTASDGLPYAVKWTPNYMPGDFNHDDRVDARDFVTWRQGYGTKYFDNDYTAWRAHYGQSATGSGAASSTSIPEPTTLLLLLTAAALAATTRRQK